MYLKRKIKNNIKDTVLLDKTKTYCYDLWTKFSSFIKDYNCNIEYIDLVGLYTESFQKFEIRHQNKSFCSFTGPDTKKLKEDIKTRNLSEDFYKFLKQKNFIENKTYFTNNLDSLTSEPSIHLDIKILKNTCIIRKIAEESVCYSYFENDPILNIVTPVNVELQDQRDFIFKHQKAFIDIFNLIKNEDDLIIHPTKNLLQKATENNRHLLFDYKLWTKKTKEKSPHFKQFINHVENNFIEKISFCDTNMILRDFSIGIRKNSNRGFIYIAEDLKNFLTETEVIAVIE